MPHEDRIWGWWNGESGRAFRREGGRAPPFSVNPNNIVEALSSSLAPLPSAFFFPHYPVCKIRLARQRAAAEIEAATAAVAGMFLWPGSRTLALSADVTAVGVSSVNVCFKSELLEDRILRAE